MAMDENRVKSGRYSRGSVASVITSYSIHYTKLYDALERVFACLQVRAGRRHQAVFGFDWFAAGVQEHEAASAVGVLRHARLMTGLAEQRRITSYNVCYTKLLRHRIVG